MIVCRLIRFLALAAAALALASCGSGRPIHYYTVEVPPAPAAAVAAPESAVTVLIGRIGAPEILQDAPIAYRTGANEIGVYGYHQWVEPPTRMVRVMLLRRLRTEGGFKSVMELGSSAQGDFILQGRLYEFEEVDSPAITALVSMEFELIDRKSRQTVWTHFYSRTEPVQGQGVPDVVAALQRNLVRGLDEVASGLNAYLAAHHTDGKS